MEDSKKKATAYLTQIYGEATNRKFKLMCSKISIGRGFHAEIRLRNPNISRNHCTLFYSSKGWTITDNKSQNGTYISGKQLKPGECRLLQCGDIIFLGPPSEMPEAFCYDDAFIDDDDIMESGHEIIELPPVKRFNQEDKTASKKKSLAEKSVGFESNKIVSPPANQELAVESEIEVAAMTSPKKKSLADDSFDIESNKIVSPPTNPELIMESELEVSHFVEISDSSPRKNESFSLTQPVKISKSSSKLNDACTVNQTSQSPPQFSGFFPWTSQSPSKKFELDNVASQISQSLSPKASSSKKLKLDNSDSGYQINEISSTGDDQDSLSLLDVEKSDMVEPSCSNSDEPSKIPTNIPTNAQDSQTVSELDILKSKLALMADQMKRIEESKINLLKNYEVVCEKNFALDQQLSEKKKIEEDLKSCETKVEFKIKNELLEKFEEDLICNICTELLIKPTVLDCSHTFCLHCIKEWKKKKNECPICRRRIATMTPVLTLEHFIDKTLATLTPDQRERRNQLIKEREEQPKKPATPTSRRRRNGRRRFRQANNVPIRMPQIPNPSVSIPQMSIPSVNLSLLNQRSVPITGRQSDIQIVAERRNNIPSTNNVAQHPYRHLDHYQMLIQAIRTPNVLWNHQ